MITGLRGLNGKVYKATYLRCLLWMLRQKFITPTKVKISRRFRDICQFFIAREYRWCKKCGNINEYKHIFFMGSQYEINSWGFKVKLPWKEVVSYFPLNYKCYNCRRNSK